MKTCNVAVGVALIVIVIIYAIRVWPETTINPTSKCKWPVYPPSDPGPNYKQKMCRYRNFGLYNEQMFRWISGAGCYNFTNRFWMVNDSLPCLTYQYYPLDGVNYTIPFTYINGSPALFDYHNDTYVGEIKTIFKEKKYYQKWENCAREAERCCSEEMSFSNRYPTEDYPCPAIWDGFTCYDMAKANTTVSKYCPIYLAEDDKFEVCYLSSKKTCEKDGWNQVTAYGTCAASTKYKERYSFHILVLYFAIAIMVPSVVIFFSFKKLRCMKFAMHRDLILAILIKNILVVLSKNYIILDAIETNSNNIMRDNGVPCRIFAFIESWSKNIIFTIMLTNGYYLHSTIVRIFRKTNMNIYLIYLFIAVASLTPTLIWATLMAVNDKTNCWMADSESWFQWIGDGYKYGTLVINMILLIDIIRIILTKLKGSDNKNKRQASIALKATFVLLPIFGAPFLITSQRSLFDMYDCTASDIYYYVTYSIEALQGVLISGYFCYYSDEVLIEIEKAYYKLDTIVREKFGLEERRRTVTRRRTTGFTNISGRF